MNELSIGTPYTALTPLNPEAVPFKPAEIDTLNSRIAIKKEMDPSLLHEKVTSLSKRGDANAEEKIARAKADFELSRKKLEECSNQTDEILTHLFADLVELSAQHDSNFAGNVNDRFTTATNQIKTLHNKLDKEIGILNDTAKNYFENLNGVLNEQLDTQKKIFDLIKSALIEMRDQEMHELTLQIKVVQQKLQIQEQQFRQNLDFEDKKSAFLIKARKVQLQAKIHDDDVMLRNRGLAIEEAKVENTRKHQEDLIRLKEDKITAEKDFRKDSLAVQKVIALNHDDTERYVADVNASVMKEKAKLGEETRKYAVDVYARVASETARLNDATKRYGYDKQAETEIVVRVIQEHGKTKRSFIQEQEKTKRSLHLKQSSRLRTKPILPIDGPKEKKGKEKIHDKRADLPLSSGKPYEQEKKKEEEVKKEDKKVKVEEIE